MWNGLPSITGYFSSDVISKAIAGDVTKLSEEDKLRMEEAGMIRRCLTGVGLEKDVTEALQRRYHPDTFNQLKFDQGVADHNMLTRDIVDKIAIEWQNGADYGLTDDEGTDLGGDLLSAFVQALEFDNRIRETSRQVRLHKAAALVPCVVLDEQTGKRKMVVHIHTPESFTLIPSKEDVCGFSGIKLFGHYYNAKGNRVERMVVWTAQSVAEFEAQEQGRWAKTAEGENPYRMIPAVLARMNSPVMSPWVDSYGPMLATKTIEANCWETVLGFKGSSQVKVIGGTFGNWPAGQYLRDAGVVDYGDATNVQVMDLQTDLGGFAKVMIERLRQQACNSVGLGSDEFEQTGTPASGESLKMRYWKRDQQAMMVRNHLVEAVKQLYWVSLNVAWVESKRTGQKGADGEAVPEIQNLPEVLPPYVQDKPNAFRFRCDPREVVYPELAAEAQAKVDWELTKGLTNRAKVLQAKNPDLDDDQARQQVEENLLLEAKYSNPGKMALEVRKRNVMDAMGQTQAAPVVK